MKIDTDQLRARTPDEIPTAPHKLGRKLILRPRRSGKADAALAHAQILQAKLYRKAVGRSSPRD